MDQQPGGGAARLGGPGLGTYGGPKGSRCLESPSEHVILGGGGRGRGRGNGRRCAGGRAPRIHEEGEQRGEPLGLLPPAVCCCRRGGGSRRVEQPREGDQAAARNRRHGVRAGVGAGAICAKYRRDAAPGSVDQRHDSLAPLVVRPTIATAHSRELRQNGHQRDEALYRAFWRGGRSRQTGGVGVEGSEDRSQEA